MQLDFSIIRDLLSETVFLSEREKKIAIELFQVLETDLSAVDWIRLFAPFKTQMEYFWHKLEGDVEICDLEIQGVVASKHMGVRKRLSDVGIRVTDSAVSTELNGDRDLLQLKMKRADMMRLVHLFRSVVFNLSKDVVVQDSVNARREGG